MLFRWQPGGRKVDFFVSWLYPKQVVQNLGSFSIVGGFSPTPFRKICSSKWGFIFPQISGWKIKNVSETYVRQNGFSSSPNFGVNRWTLKKICLNHHLLVVFVKKTDNNTAGTKLRKRCSPTLLPVNNPHLAAQDPAQVRANIFWPKIFLWP